MTFRFEKTHGRTMTMDPPQLTEIYKSWRSWQDPLPLSFSGSYFTWLADYALFVVPRYTDHHPLGRLWLGDIKITEDIYTREYTLECPYTPTKKEPGAYQLTVDLIGGNVHVTAGVLVSVWPPSSPNNGGLIGVDGDEVHGVDIPAPEMKITVNFRHPQGELNKAYIDAISEIIGFPNSDTFLGYAPGEVMYLGGPFTESESEATATYNFAVSRHRTNFYIGTVLIGLKYGWDVVSPQFKDAVVSGNPVKQVDYVELIRPANRQWQNYLSRFGWGA